MRLLKVEISKLEAITELTFLLASIINIKVAMTNTIFLMVLDSYWRNNPDFDSYSTSSN